MEAERDATQRGEVCSKTKHPRDSNDSKRCKQSFKQQLQDARWRLKRKSAIAHAKYKCQECGASGRLDVHHLYYVKGKKMWQYPFKALKVMCRECHKKWHTYNRLEYREEIWSSLKEYKAPKKRKIYFVKKGGFSVQKEEPYKKPKPLFYPSTPMLTPLERARKRIRKRKTSGNTKLGFAPRSKKRLQELNNEAE